MTYLIPVIILGVCGLGAGILLTVASEIFHVETDERVEKISEALPQANCGACGFAGCADYADAIVNSGAATNLCRPGGAESATKIAEILGVSASEVTPMTAVVRCKGDCNSALKQFDFGGTQTCKAVKRFYGGDKFCKFGCIGLGDCVAVCEHNAIKIENGIARVIPALCGACGQCAEVCPNQLISIKPKSHRTEVYCSSKDTAKATKMACKSGCMGCRLCVKNCPVQAISVVDNHAVIDYSKCTECGKCAEVCPAKAIS